MALLRSGIVALASTPICSAVFLKAHVVQNESVHHPLWQVESSLAGGAPSKCTSVDQWALDSCDDTKFGQFSSFTDFLAQDPAGILGEAGETLLLGMDGPKGLSSCKTAGSGSKPLRVIVDSQYSNSPRCCSASDLDTEWLVTVGGVAEQKAMDTAKSLERESVNGIEYVQVRPSSGCSSSSKCPLVVALAGDGEIVPGMGDPWLLLQTGCSACQSELAAAIVTPKISLDLVRSDGEIDGSSDAVIDGELVPFVQALLSQDSGLDPDRVIIVASSRGVDTAFRAAVRNSDIFSMAVLSGMFRLTSDTEKLLSDSATMAKAAQGRLQSIQFHVGDLDHCFEPADFYQQLKQVVSPFKPGSPQVDLRVYPESHHFVWFAAWNSLHEVLWTARSSPKDSAKEVLLTCSGQA